MLLLRAWGALRRLDSGAFALNAGTRQVMFSRRVLLLAREGGGTTSFRPVASTSAALSSTTVRLFLHSGCTLFPDRVPSFLYFYFFRQSTEWLSSRTALPTSPPLNPSTPSNCRGSSIPFARSRLRRFARNQICKVAEAFCGGGAQRRLRPVRARARAFRALHDVAHKAAVAFATRSRAFASPRSALEKLVILDLRAQHPSAPDWPLRV